MSLSRRRGLVGAATVALLVGGAVAAVALAEGEPTTGTATFTNVVTYTIPTVTESTTVTETVVVTEPAPPTTSPPPPPTTTEPAPTATVQPGQSWDAAYKAASPGDVILLAAGEHGVQTFSYDASKSGPARVTFRGAAGASVTDLNFKASHIAVENVAVGERWYVYPGASNLLLTDVSAERFYIRCGINVTVRGGVYSDPQASGVPSISSGGGQTIPSWARPACADDAAPSRDVVLDGVAFERIWRPKGDTSSHRECLHVMGVVGLTVRGSSFRECLGNTAAVSFNIHFGSRIEGVLFEDVLVDDTYGGGGFPQPTGTGPSVNISDRAPGYEISFRRCRLLDGSPVVAQGHPVYPGAIRFEQCVFGGAPNMGGAGSEYVWDYTVGG